jgi:hypothetical protein
MAAGGRPSIEASGGAQAPAGARMLPASFRLRTLAGGDRRRSPVARSAGGVVRRSAVAERRERARGGLTRRASVALSSRRRRGVRAWSVGDQGEQRLVRRDRRRCGLASWQRGAGIRGRCGGRVVSRSRVVVQATRIVEGRLNHAYRGSVVPRWPEAGLRGRISRPESPGRPRHPPPDARGRRPARRSARHLHSLTAPDHAPPTTAPGPDATSARARRLPATFDARRRDPRDVPAVERPHRTRGAPI